MPKNLKTNQDLITLTKKSPLVIITTYRGNWCPFCLQYLRDLNKALKKLPDNTLLVGVSVDNEEECQKLQSILKLNFDLLSDETLLLRDQFNITTGKGHGKEAYLQPSVLIFKEGEKIFEWVQQPKWQNFGGAINRLSVSKVRQQISKIV